MSEYDQDDNPSYLLDQKQKYASEFSSLAIVELSVDEVVITNILFPQKQIVAAITLKEIE
jgi:hypothetical protein